MSFVELQRKFALPDYMLYYYLQLSHAVKAQGNAMDWSLSHTPIFHLIQSATKTKGFNDLVLSHALNGIFECLLHQGNVAVGGGCKNLDRGSVGGSFSVSQYVVPQCFTEGELYPSETPQDGKTPRPTVW